MAQILHVESSAQVGGLSMSRAVAQKLVGKLRNHMGAEVILRDLAAVPLPHVNDVFVEAMFVASEERTATHNLALAMSEALIQEIESADAIVIGCPMYNYSVPSALKAWLDHVVRARRTFVHTLEGPRGLLKNRPVYVVISSGGIYSEGAATKVDFVSPYLTAVFGKIGLHNLGFLRVEGIALGGEILQKSLAGADRFISGLESMLEFNNRATGT